MRLATLITVFGAILVAPTASASGVITRCHVDISRASAPLALQDEWRDDSIAMTDEISFMRTASLSEIQALSWQDSAEKQEGVYTILAFQGRAYESPPEVSEPFISEETGMWCSYLTRRRFRNRVVITLDINGNIVERDVRKILAPKYD